LNILLINHYAGTPALGMEYRPYYLAREWVRLGHSVHIVASNVSHVRTQQPAVGTEVIDGITYTWLPTPPYLGNGLGRVRNLAAFLRGVWRMTGDLVAHFKPQAVIASSTYPMDNWVARRIARRAGAKWFYEVHDLWPLSLIELAGMSPWHPFALLCQWAEASAYRHADGVVSMLPKVQQHMAGRGLDLHKLHIVPNGISPEEWDLPAALAEPLRSDVAQALQRARAAGHTVVGYAGSMGAPNALDCLWDAAKRLLKESSHQTSTGTLKKPFSIVCVGDGHERARLQQRLQSEGISNISWYPPINKAQVPAFLAAVDIAYIGWQRVPIYRFGIAPNKLMDYMMAGRAVLHAVEAGNDPVAEAACGVTVEPESPAAVAAGLCQLAALSADERAAMGRRGRAFVLAQHSYPVLAQRFIAALEGCA
jgi:glycosyltransferase involved in cell wall biosynthesis